MSDLIGRTVDGTLRREPERKGSDLISRQEAIDAILNLTNCKSVRELYEYTVKHKLQNEWTGGVVDAIDMVIAVPAKNDGEEME